MKASTSSVNYGRLNYFQIAGASKYRKNQRFSSSTALGSPNLVPAPGQGVTKSKVTLPSLSIMPTKLLLRSYFITSILASPRILKISLPLMNKIANSDSTFLNPDRNPLLHTLVRRLIYDHFMAGESEFEVRRTVTAIKKIGFKGVILGYAREAQVTDGRANYEVADELDVDSSKTNINAWKKGTLNTLGMIGEGDFLAVKFSGAGASTLKALATHNSPPTKMWEGVHEICERASKQNTRIWMDAEQQDLQGTIEAWTIDLMRHYNKGEKAMIYTTMQAYLKHTPENILRHLKITQEQGWTLGIKLVRGAYIATEHRNLIHDTIEDTHKAYNTIAENLLRKSYPGISPDKPYPKVSLFLATHNEESIKTLYAVQKSLILAGKPTVELGYGQLQGMADEISCGLLQHCQDIQSSKSEGKNLGLSPDVFKCLCWGSTQECLQFLLRRVKENEDALTRTKSWVAGFRKELWRRLKLFVKVV